MSLTERHSSAHLYPYWQRKTVNRNSSIGWTFDLRPDPAFQFWRILLSMQNHRRQNSSLVKFVASLIRSSPSWDDNSWNLGPRSDSKSATWSSTIVDYGWNSDNCVQRDSARSAMVRRRAAWVLGLGIMNSLRLLQLDCQVVQCSWSIALSSSFSL